MVSFFQHPFYPYTGADAGVRKHDNAVNVPVPAHTAGAAIRDLILEKWLPALHAHRPEMIFISAGFAAHREDDIGQLGQVEADYAWITQQIMAVASRPNPRRSPPPPASIAGISRPGMRHENTCRLSSRFYAWSIAAPARSG